MMRLSFEVPPRTRRVQCWSIEVSRLLDLLRANDGIRRIKMDGLPADAKPIGATIHHSWNTIKIYLESDQFGEVPDGERPPELDIVFTEFLEREVPEATP